MSNPGSQDEATLRELDNDPDVDPTAFDEETGRSSSEDDDAGPNRDLVAEEVAADDAVGGKTADDDADATDASQGDLDTGDDEGEERDLTLGQVFDGEKSVDEEGEEFEEDESSETWDTQRQKDDEAKAQARKEEAAKKTDDEESGGEDETGLFFDEEEEKVEDIPELDEMATEFDRNRAMNALIQAQNRSTKSDRKSANEAAYLHLLGRASIVAGGKQHRNTIATRANEVMKKRGYTKEKLPDALQTEDILLRIAHEVRDEAAVKNRGQRRTRTQARRGTQDTGRGGTQTRPRSEKVDGMQTLDEAVASERGALKRKR